MTSVAHQRLASEVATAAPTVKIGGGKLVRFTRHPQALAKACVLELQACARFVLEVLLTSADKRGYTWVQAKEIASITPRSAHVRRYSLPSVLRALRQLRAAGLVSWERVPALARYPRRNKDGTLTEGAGKWTQGGGRTWRVDVDKLRSLGAPSAPGTSLAGSITHDRSGSITHDRPIEDHGSLSENLYKEDRASQARPAPAAPERQARPQVTPPPPSRAVAPSASSSARPTAAKVASETPRAPAAVSAARAAPSSARESERHGGRGEQERGQEQARMMTRDELARGLAELASAIKNGGPRPGVRSRT